MPLVRYYVATSIDGFIATRDGGTTWLDAFHGEGGRSWNEFIGEIGGIIMGRASWEKMLSFGPWDLSQPTMVLTSRSLAAPVDGVETFSGDVNIALAKLAEKVTKGDIWLVGGGKAAAQLLDAGLIDRLELTVMPIVLGRGIPLFEGAKNMHTLSLESTRETGLGRIESTYVKRG